MIAPRGRDATPQLRPIRAPSLRRRMASFVYESMLLFGIGLVPGALGALFFAQTGQRSALQGETALRLFAWVFYGVYFVWFWSARGQTLAMQTWHIGVVSAAGEPLPQARAFGRYAACCAAWFAAPTIIAMVLHLPPWPSLGLTAAWIAGYAVLALAAPGHQFWHDVLCRTRLVDAREAEAAGWLRPRLR